LGSVRRVLLLVCAAVVLAAGAAATSTRSATVVGCDVEPGSPTNVAALAGAVVQAADLPQGWRLQRALTLPKGTSADGPSAKRLGGAVVFARQISAPELALTSVAELEASPAAACRTYHSWLRSLLGAGVGTRLRTIRLSLGRESALLESKETAFGPMVEISWYRGPVYAAVQVQFRAPAAAAAAHRMALLFAAAADARLRRIAR
jgi:hypothetical protein